MTLPEITELSELEQIRSKTSNDPEVVTDREIMRRLALYPLLVETETSTTDEWGKVTTTITYTGQYTSFQRVLLVSADLIEEKISDVDWDFIKVEDIELRMNFNPKKMNAMRKRAGQSDFRIL